MSDHSTLYPCCRHCPSDPDWHDENVKDTHEASCSTCDQDVRARTLAEVAAHLEELADEYERTSLRGDAPACYYRDAAASVRGLT